jgi:hypothetical protein
MSDRDARYMAAVCLAQMILEQPAADDDRLLSEAVSLLTAEVHAGRQHQAAFPVVSAELFEQLTDAKPRLHSVRVDHEEAAS